MDIKFCGAAGHVTGSAHLVTLDNGYKILLDCGLYQGNDNEMDDFGIIELGDEIFEEEYLDDEYLDAFDYEDLL